MDSILKKDIIQWDIAAWWPALNYWDANVNWTEVNQCLELGGRQGGLSLWLALKGKKTICSDLKNVENTANELHSRYQLNNLIEYQNLDATELSFENYFDLIVFKSILGSIGQNGNLEKQQRVFTEVYKALKPGGKLLFAENLISTPLHQVLRKNFVTWGGRYVSIKELNDFLSPFSKFEIKSTGVLSVFGRNERQRNFLTGIDRKVFNKICPDRFKYIGFGYAVK